MNYKQKAYKYIYFEISGNCNAKCTYCVTGISKESGKLVNIDKFKKSINNLFKKNLANSETVFHLYNWGEPMLHPKLDQILDFLFENKIKFCLSSNLSILQKNLRPEHFTYLKTFVVSTPGFSQMSYDKIHQLDFSIILNNLNLLTQLVPKEKIIIAFHIYQFNIIEYKQAKEYYSNLNLRMLPYYAYFNNYDQATRYLNNELGKNELETISKELLLHYVDDLLEEMPSNYRCPQFDILTIDENCQIITCCVVPRNSSSYKVCDVNEVSESYLNEKVNKDICKKCYKTKLVYWAHTHTKQSSEFINKIFGNNQ